MYFWRCRQRDAPRAKRLIICRIIWINVIALVAAFATSPRRLFRFRRRSDTSKMAEHLIDLAPSLL